MKEKGKVHVTYDEIGDCPYHHRQHIEVHPESTEPMQCYMAMLLKLDERVIIEQRRMLQQKIREEKKNGN